jgi:predicted transcriptional regulator
MTALEAVPFRLSDQPAEPEIVATSAAAATHRLRILQLLDTTGELTVGELVDRLALPQWP